MAFGQIAGGAAVFVTVGWLLYTTSSGDPCERVDRAAAPVRVFFDMARSGAQHWVGQETRLDLLLMSVRANEGAKKMVANHFYGNENLCQKPSSPAVQMTDPERVSGAQSKPAPSPADALPEVQHGKEKP